MSKDEPWPDCLAPEPVFVVSSTWRADGRARLYPTEELWNSWRDWVDAYWPNHEDPECPWPGEVNIRTTEPLGVQ